MMIEDDLKKVTGIEFALFIPEEYVSVEGACFKYIDGKPTFCDERFHVIGKGWTIAEAWKDFKNQLEMRTEFYVDLNSDINGELVDETLRD